MTTLEASEDKKTVRLSLEDLGFTEDEWKQMSHEEQMVELQKYANELPEQPYWWAVKIEEI